MLLLVPIAFMLRGTVKPIESYRTVDADTISVRVFHGCCSWVRIGGLDQGEDSVRIEVRESAVPIGRGSIGLQSELIADLDAPLGGRRVIDAATGADVPREDPP